MTQFSSDAKEDRAYNSTSDVRKTYRTNPEHDRQQGSTLASATGQGNGTSYYYIDFSGYRYASFQIESTAGLAGTNTFTFEISNEGSVSPSSATYQDATNALFGVASATATTFWIIDTPQTFRYARIKVVRTLDGANNDGAWDILCRMSW